MQENLHPFLAVKRRQAAVSGVEWRCGFSGFLTLNMEVRMRPVIGITMDWQWGGTFSQKPHYALREHYFECVAQAGGVPVGLPPDRTRVRDSLEAVKGIVIPGGSFVTPAGWYVNGHEVKGHHPRPEADLRTILMALEMDKPLLAICAGCQELAVAMGGKLHHVLKNVMENCLNHKADMPERVAHDVTVMGETGLDSLLQRETFGVNSHHNGGIADHGKAKVCAMAPDGVVEALEVPGARFAYGVMWHPEYLISPQDQALWDGLVGAAFNA